MIWLVLALSACSLAALISTPLLLLRFYHREKDALRREVEELLRGVITAPDEKTPSPLAVLCDQMATLFAARLVQNVKSTLSGVEHELARGEQLGLFEEAAGQHPWLGLIAGMIPKKLRNSLIRNPQMVSALSKMVGGGGSGDGSTGVEGQPPRRHRE